MSADLSHDLLALEPAFGALAGSLNRRLLLAGQAPLDVEFLSERARSMSLSFPGRTSANGSCRLVRAQDGWIAVNLARETDLDLLPAWLETDRAAHPIDDLDRIIADRPGAHWRDRGRLLGMAVSCLGEAAAVAACRITRPGPPRAVGSSFRVIDLSSLWAGPLCGHLLQGLGAEVIKVESRTRPDGARRGSPALFDRLNGGKQQLALDFHDPADRARLRDMILSADVVIEASRPRALRNLGLDAETLMPDAPGLTWVSITAHGRAGDAGERVGFGDDAAVAGGLVGRHPDGGPRFIADAVADPLTGVHAASQVMAAREQGGGALLDIAMAGVAAVAARILAPALAA